MGALVEGVELEEERVLEGEDGCFKEGRAAGGEGVLKEEIVYLRKRRRAAGGRGRVLKEV